MRWQVRYSWLLVFFAAAIGCAPRTRPESVAPCDLPAQDASAWQQTPIIGEGFTYRLPSGYKLTETIGVDIPLLEFAKGRRILQFGEASLSAPLSLSPEPRDSTISDFSECVVDIAGHRARLATYRRLGEYYARALWESFPGRWRLSFFFRSPDRAGQVEAIAIFRNVHASP
jgi:hypothetical protein